MRSPARICTLARKSRFYPGTTRAGSLTDAKTWIADRREVVKNPLDPETP
jgi:hypothetical protein